MTETLSENSYFNLYVLSHVSPWVIVFIIADGHSDYMCKYYKKACMINRQYLHNISMHDGQLRYYQKVFSEDRGKNIYAPKSFPVI